MNKEVKKAAAILEEKEHQNRELLEKAETELNATREKLSALRANLDGAENAQQYKEILQQVRDEEAILEFCKKRAAEARAKTLSEEDFRSLTQKANEAFDKLKTEQRAAILAETEKLWNLLTAYDADVAELNSVIVRAAQLHKDDRPATYTAQTIGTGDPRLQAIVSAFYKTKAAAILMQGGRV